VGELMDIPQLAKRLRVSKRKVQELAREKNRPNQRIPIPVIRIGRAIRFRADQIDEWLQQLQEAA